jgi:hypothetical protein
VTHRTLYAPPKVLAYAQITANQNGIGTSATDVTGLSITFTAGQRPVWVEASIALVKLNTAAGDPGVFITDSANNAVKSWNRTMTAGASGEVILRRRLAILTPGTSYTFKVRAQAPTGATFDVRANTDVIPTVLAPAYICAYEE